MKWDESRQPRSRDEQNAEISEVLSVLLLNAEFHPTFESKIVTEQHFTFD